MDFENLELIGGRGGDVDVAFFAYANLVAETVDRVATSVGIKGEVVNASVSEAIAVI